MLPILTLLETYNEDHVRVELPNVKVAFVAGMLLPLALTAFTVVRVPLTTRAPETNIYEFPLAGVRIFVVIFDAITLEVVVVAYTFTVTTLAVVDKVPVTATLP
jgi:hypothetical protein